MAKSILQQLFDGEVYPLENIGKNSAKYQEMTKTLDEKKGHFSENLSEADREQFAKIDDLHYEAARLYSYESFVCGFRLGVKLIFESLDLTDIFTIIDNT